MAEKLQLPQKKLPPPDLSASESRHSGHSVRLPESAPGSMARVASNYR
jgi:hypothetical protein